MGTHLCQDPGALHKQNPESHFRKTRAGIYSPKYIVLCVLFYVILQCDMCIYIYIYIYIEGERDVHLYVYIHMYTHVYTSHTYTYRWPHVIRCSVTLSSQASKTIHLKRHLIKKIKTAKQQFRKKKMSSQASTLLALGGGRAPAKVFRDFRGRPLLPLIIIIIMIMISMNN